MPGRGPGIVDPGGRALSFPVVSEEPVRIPIEDEIDLHAFRPGETAALVADYVEEAARLGLTTVRIVHGRGAGVQRRIVRAALERSPFVVSFADAPPASGGWGATVATLDPLRSNAARGADGPRLDSDGKHEPS